MIHNIYDDISDIYYNITYHKFKYYIYIHEHYIFLSIIMMMINFLVGCAFDELINLYNEIYTLYVNKNIA